MELRLEHRGDLYSPICAPIGSLAEHPDAVCRAERYYPISHRSAIVSCEISSIWPTGQGVLGRQIFQTAATWYLATLGLQLCAFPIPVLSVYGAPIK